MLKEQLIYILIKYLLYNMSSHRFIFTKLTQILITYIKFSIILGLIINIPFILGHIFYFFNSALYKHE
jgi:Sec-independent protein secretion pathway component TatC